MCIYLRERTGRGNGRGEGRNRLPRSQDSRITIWATQVPPEIFYFYKVQFTHFSFMISVFYVLRSLYLTQCHKGFSPLFSSRSFVDFNFTFKFMAHFEVIFESNMRFLSVCIWMSSCSNTVEKDYSFPLGICVKNQLCDHNFLDFWNLSVLFHRTVYIFFISYHGMNTVVL